MHLVRDGQVLHTWGSSAKVVRVGEGHVVKATNDETSARTEYHGLKYLQKCLPSFPAPRGHGLISSKGLWLLFTTWIPGLTLEKAWSRLEGIQKRNISGQLDTLFSSLRSLPFPENTPLGGIDGQGCRDARRWLRTNSEPITNIEQFEDFIFSASRAASPIYTQLLRDLRSDLLTKCNFTHGDLRPANIIVDEDEDGTWKIVGVVDWESSGFYPDYWETVKMTNNLVPSEESDWYRYLPQTLSPSRYPTQWLVDRLWDSSMENGG